MHAEHIKASIEEERRGTSRGRTQRSGWQSFVAVRDTFDKPEKLLSLRRSSRTANKRA